MRSGSKCVIMSGAKSVEERIKMTSGECVMMSGEECIEERRKGRISNIQILLIPRQTFDQGAQKFPTKEV